MRFVIVFLIFFCTETFGQSLSSLNLHHWYDPNTEIEFVMTPLNKGKSFRLYYQLISNRKENSIDNYSINWELRNTLEERDGQNIIAVDSTLFKNINTLKGMLILPPPAKHSYIMAQVVNNSTQQSYIFYRPLDPQWPVSGIVNAEGFPLLKSFVPIASSISFQEPEKKLNGFFYKLTFGAAKPPYAETVAGDPFLKSDSTFTSSGTIVPKTIGLYLFQEDSTTNSGISFIAANKVYPKYNTIADLAGPLVYICTDEEYQDLQAAAASKPTFDNFILNLTGDKDRAKNLMRSYFQRVEAANRYFTDYKEGWKTDRGMIYIIFGLPDDVTRTANQEIWNYKIARTKFTFNLAGSIFNPETYKLHRGSQYMMQWFSQIDLWRKSRF